MPVLVNSTGIAGPDVSVVEYPSADCNRIMAINLNGAVDTNRGAVREMRKTGYGRIVNVTSVAGKETADTDIAVNRMTPAAARSRVFVWMKRERIDYMLSKTPRGRFLESTRRGRWSAGWPHATTALPPAPCST